MLILIHAETAGRAASALRDQLRPPPPSPGHSPTNLRRGSLAYALELGCLDSPLNSRAATLNWRRLAGDATSLEGRLSRDLWHLDRFLSWDLDSALDLRAAINSGTRLASDAIPLGGWLSDDLVTDSPLHPKAVEDGS